MYSTCALRVPILALFETLPKRLEENGVKRKLQLACRVVLGNRVGSLCIMLLLLMDSQLIEFIVMCIPGWLQTECEDVRA
ncbi:hypothetical protein CPB83DRAFT_861691 [Crepidotus variabilis]|uniref:Uncharacterized protein n=1 Tax=Crepidotus variabilis TaxID=179855 RepID=A0A9P6E864_9AGAR|nr:hypothetical protein CPB83DRAFT_861691 [Crepidotus variabilis]